MKGGKHRKPIDIMYEKYQTSVYDTYKQVVSDIQSRLNLYKQEIFASKKWDAREYAKLEGKIEILELLLEFWVRRTRPPSVVASGLQSPRSDKG